MSAPPTPPNAPTPSSPLTRASASDEDAYAHVTNFINTDHRAGAAAFAMVRRLHAKGHGPHTHFVVVWVPSIPLPKRLTEDNEPRLYKLTRRYLADSVRRESGCWPLDQATAIYVEHMFSFQPAGYYALVVLNSAAETALVTWLPKPKSA
jgi:hypothetical protein